MRRQINKEVLLSEWNPKPKQKPKRRIQNGCRLWSDIAEFFALKVFGKYRISELGRFCQVSRETARRWTKGQIPKEEHISRISIFLATPYISAIQVEDELRRRVDSKPRRINR